MISIGYSTRVSNPNFKKHILSTIGLKENDVEIIEIINNGDKSLSECYDIIIQSAKNNRIVICHDDISFSKSPKWGKKVISHLENKEDYGIIGVAGTTKLTDNAIWWSEKKKLIGIVEHSDSKKTWTSNFSSNINEEIADAVVLDGVFIALNRDKLKYFPDKNIDNFHFYDLDFTLGNFLNGCKVGVVTNIRLIHKSIGQTNENWEINRKKFIEKWGDSLNQEVNPKIFFKGYHTNIKKEPKVGIIILNKSNNRLLFNCLKSILLSRYSNYKIYIGDTGSTDEELEEIKDFIVKDKRIKLFNIGEYHFAKNNNYIVKNIIDKDTDLLLFSNNDVKLVTDVIEQMVDTYLKNKNNVGTLGCRLYYEDNSIQHAGIGLYKRKLDNKLLGFTHLGINSSYQYGNQDLIEVIGNTAAFMMVSLKLFEIVGGFNENYSECFEDAEFNLKLVTLNKKNYFLRNAVAYHYESKTRELNPDKTINTQRDYNNILLPFVRNNYNKLSRLIIEI